MGAPTLPNTVGTLAASSDFSGVGMPTIAGLFVVELVVGTLISKKMGFKSPVKAGLVGAIVFTVLALIFVVGIGE